MILSDYVVQMYRVMEYCRLDIVMLNTRDKCNQTSDVVTSTNMDFASR